eukprot:TRINITY_DN779929_c0_g1_i1.p1 TRINITY_DN779929_c0_g1~~TRINITY_DN779929_c0_g1_i1.p1  ORF type:complete len:188 (+),score=22.78 TRINITY_DN779929_c0_g1_i1:33-566(+)
MAILVLGSSGAGKTLFVRRLRAIFSKDSEEFNKKTVPTTGFEMDTLEYKKSELTFREIGSCMMPMWPKYFKKSDAIIFVVDGCNQAQVCESSVEFLNLVGHPDIENKAVLVLINKIDSRECLSTEELASCMMLEEVLESPACRCSIHFARCSALTGEQCNEVLDWVAEETYLESKVI